MVLSGVSPTVALGAIFTLVSGGLFGGLLRLTEHPKKEYEDDVEALQQDRWNDVCAELGPVVADVYSFVDNGDDGNPENLSDGQRAGNLLRQALDDRGDLESVEQELQRLDEPKKVFKRCRKERTDAIRLSGYSFVGFGIYLLISIESTYTDLGSLVIVAAGVFIVLALSSLKNHFDKRQELDEMTEDLNFM